jgi:hypothetical protein
MVELIGRAQRRLDEILVDTFAHERRRFDALAASPADLDALAADLREAADDLRRLPTVVPMDAVAMFGGPGAGSALEASATDATRTIGTGAPTPR